MSDKERFRIWYSDGEICFGWLHWEGSHGRNGDVATYDKEGAEAQMELERRDQREYHFVMIPVGASDKEFDRLADECRAAARKAQRARWSGR